MAVGAVAAAAMVVGVVAAGMAVGVEAVAFTAEAVGLPDFTVGAVAGMAEAVDTMGLPMAAGPTWVMGGVGTDLLVTP
jgi:hypothetical protein